MSHEKHEALLLRAALCGSSSDVEYALRKALQAEVEHRKLVTGRVEEVLLRYDTAMSTLEAEGLVDDEDLEGERRLVAYLKDLLTVGRAL